MGRICGAISALACALLCACGSLSSRELDAADAPGALRAADLQAEVDALARPLVEDGETPGIVVGVLLPDGSRHFFGYGEAGDGSGRAPDADTVFAVGSLSKPFLDTIAARLVREGVISWSDTLGELLPAGAGLSADARRITLLELATHTSGLPRQPMDFATFRQFVGYLFTGENFYRHYDLDFLLAYLADFEAPAEKAERYSNIGYALLGHVLEQRSGRSLEALLDDEIARPLGLTRTAFAPEALPAAARRARGHAGDQPKFIARGTPVADWRFDGAMRASGGLHSSARDLLAYAAASLAPDAPAVPWGEEDTDGALTWRVGVIAGFASYLGIDAERRTAVVVLQNSFNWTDKVGHRLLARLHRADTIASHDR